MIADKLVKIDREVYEAVRKKARGFETFNQALRRILEMTPSETRRGKRSNSEGDDKR